MKTIITFLVSVCPLLAQAQNWQCLQSTKHYFINANSYVRGMRIDSVRTMGSNTVYYPYHTVRGYYPYHTHTALDTTSGSWLGKKVIQQSNGIFLFDNHWSDTVVINTQAHTGDTWTFFRDARTTHYYTATLTAEDTMIVLGSLDSIKKITINAYGVGGPDLTDSLNNAKIILSKNNGFVQTFDLYTFPYHRPDTTYYRGADLYVDLVMLAPFEFCVTDPAQPLHYSNMVFTLTHINNPTYTQLYRWNTGDVFENTVFTDTIPNDGMYPYEYYFDSITSKTTVAGGIQYNYQGWKATQHIPYWLFWPGRTFDPSLNYPYDTASTTGSFIISNNLLIDTTRMPEEWLGLPVLYYHPADTSYCLTGTVYHFVMVTVDNAGLLCSEGYPPVITYKTGVGLINWDFQYLGGEPPLIKDTTLKYYVKSGTPCGTYVYPWPINNIALVPNITGQSFHIFPNPAASTLTLSTPGSGQYTVAFADMMGRTVKTTTVAAGKATLDISDMPPGVYVISINDGNGIRMNAKLVVER